MDKILLIILLLVIGFILIIKGGDYFVDGASWLAEVSGIPKFIVGATIVSIATTLPEILVSLISAKAEADMAIGNAIGSVVFNTGIIMSIALIANPFKINRKDYLFKGIILVSVMALLFVFSFQGVNFKNISNQTTGIFGYVGAAILLLIFIVFIVDNVLSAKFHSEDDNDGTVRQHATKKTVVLNLLKLILGAAGITLGAVLLKDNAVKLATIAGISQAVIGATILAIGTSLPELVTMIIALKKGEGSLSIGNIVGANTIDISIILPLSAFIAGGNGLPVSNFHLFITMPITLIIIIIGIVPTLINKKFTRIQGLIMLIIYLAFFVYNIVYVVM